MIKPVYIHRMSPKKYYYCVELSYLQFMHKKTAHLNFLSKRTGNHYNVLVKIIQRYNCTVLIEYDIKSTEITS